MEIRIQKCRLWQLCCYGVTVLVFHIFCAAAAFLFALVGGTLGAIIGSIIGRKSETGVVHAAIIGAITGGVFSIEVVRISLSFLFPDNSRFSWFFALIDCAKNHVTRQLSREWTYHSIVITGNLTDEDALERYIGTRNDSKKQTETTGLTKNDSLKSSWSGVACSICLQGFERQRPVRRVPCCQQAFHPPCIDKWLNGHNSCPLCRSIIVNKMQITSQLCC